MSQLQLSDHVVQKSPYWRANDAPGHVEERKFKFGGFLSLTCPSASFALQYGDFVPRDSSAAKGPLLRCAIFRLWCFYLYACF